MTTNKGINLLVFTRNSHFQEEYSKARAENQRNDFRILIKSSMEDVIARLELGFQVEDKRIEAIVADADNVSFKMMEWVSQHRGDNLIVCCVVVPPTEEEFAQKIIRLPGVNLVMSTSNTATEVLATIQASVLKANKVDNLFKDLRETRHRDKDHPYLPVFDGVISYDDPSSRMDRKSFDPVAEASRSLDLSRFMSQPIEKVPRRPTTVAGLDKRKSQSYWREYFGTRALDHSHMSESTAPLLPEVSRRGSVISSSQHSSMAPFIDKEAFNAENNDKLKIQAVAKQNIVKLAKMTPANIQVAHVMELDLLALKINLTERDLLHKGLRYQDMGDFDLALSLFSTAGLRTARPYVSKILIGNLHYEQENFFKAIRCYGDAIVLLKHAQDTKSAVIAYFNKGVACFRVGDDQRGLQCMSKVVALDKHNLRAIEVLSVAQRRMGLSNEAIDNMMILAKHRALSKPSPVVISRSNSLALGSTDALDVSTNRRLSISSLRRKSNDSDDFPSITSEVPMPDTLPTLHLTIRPITGMSLEEMLAYRSKAVPRLEEQTAKPASTRSSLETFKLKNGFKKELSQQLFDSMSPLQSALTTKPGYRTSAQATTIATSALNLFPFLKNCTRSVLYEIAKNSEYFRLVPGTHLFSQHESVDFCALVLSGKVQYCMETSIHNIQNCVIGNVAEFEVIGAVDLLFSKPEAGLANIPRLQKEIFQDHYVSPTDSDDVLPEVSIAARSFHENMFLSYDVIEPSEVMFIRKTHFDRYLANDALSELHRALEVIDACKLFDGWMYPERIRLARMSRIRSIRAGEIILEQGQKPSFLYFMLSGMAKVYKKPNGTDFLLRRLKECKFKAEQFDLKYVYHHNLRDVLSRAPDEELPSRLRAMGHHVTLSELGREQLRAEIIKLEAALAKSSQQDPNVGYTEITDLYWPRIFGESCVLDSSETGVSLGRIVADTACEVLTIHMTQIQTFHVGDKLLANLKRKGIKYPNDELLAQEEAWNRTWNAQKDEILQELRR